MVPRDSGGRLLTSTRVIPSSSAPLIGFSSPVPREHVVRQALHGSNCDSVFFSTAGWSYSRVCGRVNAYQRGDPEGFSNITGTSPGLENAYLDGVSITHGPAGSRQHIWTLILSTDPNYGSIRLELCLH